MHGKGPIKLSKWLPEDLGRGLHRALGQVAHLGPLWLDTVDTELGHHSRPSGFVDGELCVQVDSPIWANAIRQQHQTLVSRLREHRSLANLHQIRVKVVPGKLSIGPTTSFHKVAAPVSEFAAESIRRTAESVEDPDLKAALQRLQASTHKNK